MIDDAENLEKRMLQEGDDYSLMELGTYFVGGGAMLLGALTGNPELSLTGASIYQAQTNVSRYSDH